MPKVIPEAPKYKRYRVCYPNGIPISGNEIYELSSLCHCESCVNRARYTRGSWNRATATTKDISKIDEIAGFLKNWTCGNSNSVKTVYFNF